MDVDSDEPAPAKGKGRAKAGGSTAKPAAGARGKVQKLVSFT